MYLTVKKIYLELTDKINRFDGRTYTVYCIHHTEHVFNAVQKICTFVEGLLSDLRSFADPLELNLGSRFSALNLNKITGPKTRDSIRKS
jgi:hypothetical protein